MIANREDDRKAIATTRMTAGTRGTRSFRRKATRRQYEAQQHGYREWHKELTAEVKHRNDQTNDESEQKWWRIAGVRLFVPDQVHCSSVLDMAAERPAGLGLTC